MILVAATAVVQVLLLAVVYVFHWMLVRRVPEGMDYDIEVKLLPPSIRVKLPIARYAVVLLVLVDDVWQEVRLFDNHLDDHHMHRYTRLQGKQSPETFHPGPVNAAIAAAIAHLKANSEAIIESWRS